MITEGSDANRVPIILAGSGASEHREQLVLHAFELAFPEAGNARKTRCLRCPEEAFEFLGFRIGRNYRVLGKGAYIGTRPSTASVRSIRREISELTTRQQGWQKPEVIVERLNWAITGWANYFSLGQVGPAYQAVNWHASERLRRWLWLKYKSKGGKRVRFPDDRLYGEYGLTRLPYTAKGLPSAKA